MPAPAAAATAPIKVTGSIVLFPLNPVKSAITPVGWQRAPPRWLFNELSQAMLKPQRLAALSDPVKEAVSSRRCNQPDPEVYRRPQETHRRNEPPEQIGQEEAQKCDREDPLPVVAD